MRTIYDHHDWHRVVSFLIDSNPHHVSFWRIAAKCEDRFETIDLPDAKLSQLGACRLEKLFDVAPPMVRLVVFYQMPTSGQHVAAKWSRSHAPNAIQIYPCNCGIKLHKCKDD